MTAKLLSRRASRDVQILYEELDVERSALANLPIQFMRHDLHVKVGSSGRDYIQIGVSHGPQDSGSAERRERLIQVLREICEYNILRIQRELRELGFDPDA